VEERFNHKIGNGVLQQDINAGKQISLTYLIKTDFLSGWAPVTKRMNCRWVDESIPAASYRKSFQKQ